MRKHFQNSRDALFVGISNADASLRKQKDELMSRLMELALQQNPDIARQLEVVEAEQERVRDMRRAEEISLYHEYLERKHAEHVANRKIRYDDKRNYNALNAIRRDSVYKAKPRVEQIRTELDRYWNPRGLEPPKELMDELRRLERRDVCRKAG